MNYEIIPGTVVLVGPQDAMVNLCSTLLVIIHGHFLNGGCISCGNANLPSSPQTEAISVSSHCVPSLPCRQQQELGLGLVQVAPSMPNNTSTMWTYQWRMRKRRIMNYES